MTEFKVGDRVRFVLQRIRAAYVPIGSLGRIISDWSSPPFKYGVTWDNGEHFTVAADELELVEDATDPIEETQYPQYGSAWHAEMLAEQNAPLRAQILDEAKALIVGDRNNAYGEPGADFNRTAAIWQALGFRGPDGRDLKGSDVALLMIGLKMSRATWMHKRDNFVDMAGYAACGFEVSESE